MIAAVASLWQKGREDVKRVVEKESEEGTVRRIDKNGRVKVRKLGEHKLVQREQREE